MSSPVILTITSTGQIWASCDATFKPKGATVTQQFRVNPTTTNQLVCTLTGSGNSSASALAVSNGTSGKSGSGEGQEIH